MTRRSAAVLLLLSPTAFGQANIAGTYKGKWTGMSASGDFQLRLEQESGEWKGTVQFSLANVEVPTTVRTLRVTGSAVDTTYDFDLGGNKLQSHLEGAIKDGQLSGKYKTKALADGSGVDEGTCEAKRQ